MTVEELREKLNGLEVIIDGHKITPLYEITQVTENEQINYNYVISKTAEQVYVEWQEQQNQPSIPSETQQLRADVDYIALEMGVDL